MTEELYAKLSDMYECNFRFKQGKKGYYIEHDKDGIIIRANDTAVMVFKDGKCMAYETTADHERIIEIAGWFLKKKVTQGRLF